MLIDFLFIVRKRKKIDVMGGYTSINCRAFVMAASCRTWFMTAALGSEDEEPKPRPLLMLSIFADLADLFCNVLLLIVCIRRGE